MLGAFTKLFIPKPPPAVETTYIALVAAARNPFFFTELKVPDTIDGRFGLIVVHLFLLQHRLAAEAEDFARFLSEAFFNDMDNSLRELGVGDTGVSHRIKKMGRAYHGSLQAYGGGMNDAHLLRMALARNLYGTVADGDITVLVRMADYMERAASDLAATPTATLLAGEYRWPNVASLKI